MPVDGLPTAVETILAQMVDQNELSSWKITGGKYYATVALHFRVSMADPAQGTVLNGTKQYRSKPPSAITRDKNRLDKWRSKLDVQNSGQVDNVNLPGMDKVKSDIGQCSGGNEVTVAHISIQTDERSFAPGLPVGADGSIDSDGLDSPDPILRCDTIVKPKQVDVNIDTSSTHDGNLDQVFLDTTDMHENDMDLPLCTDCQQVLQTNNWWKCTRCVTDICENCVKNGDHHTHIDQLHKFTLPTSLDSYCDSCGFEFKTRQAQYYMCVSCVNYTLCQMCMKCNAHGHHQLTLKCRSVTSDIT